MGSERNFRSHYYEKMGFRGVEEKKSLDILLRDKPVDLCRIHNFCLRWHKLLSTYGAKLWLCRFPLPGIYRVQVWQLLLGVMPVHTNNTEFVWRQRQEQYRESERALTITRRISDNTNTIERITLVWLLERNSLKVSTFLFTLVDSRAEGRMFQCDTVWHYVNNKPHCLMTPLL